MLSVAIKGESSDIQYVSTFVVNCQSAAARGCRETNNTMVHVMSPSRIQQISKPNWIH